MGVNVDTNESLKQALEHFLQQRQKKMDEIRKLDSTIAKIREELGGLSEGEEDPFIPGLAIPPETESQEPFKSKPQDIRPDEFFGMSQSEAAKAYLKRIGHAVPMEELVEALTSRGCKVGGVDPKRTLYISLVRNVREFVPPQPGFIGLREFYPSLKGGKKKP